MTSEELKKLERENEEYQKSLEKSLNKQKKEDRKAYKSKPKAPTRVKNYDVSAHNLSLDETILNYGD